MNNEPIIVHDRLFIFQKYQILEYFEKTLKKTYYNLVKILIEQGRLKVA